MSTLLSPQAHLFSNKKIKIRLFNDNFQNFKRYNIPRAQLVIADIPYNLGNNAYASNPMWYKDGDRKNGESKKAGKAFFNSDYNFNIAEFFHFCSKLLIKEPKEAGKAPCMIVFCAFEQIPSIVEYAKKHGFKNSIPLFFIKNYSAQVLKANMRIVGATEHAVILYRDKLPKFNNRGRMIYNWMEWRRDGKEIPKIHPTQKPVNLLAHLVQLFTDEGDTVIDPVAGSGSTLRACFELNRNGYGFEVSRDMYRLATEKMLPKETA
ncbi:DNA-methyltransferase [Nitratifractor salsuginis]|uniref:Methyltransferase n=1 Tax=Nitratifractor salsuginis (strain DSM 16511 / JCM 12458 / E9I37-1) TaxID=749222 RepID=E6X1S1_NITSE|nr:site-specific DNA-methyltransferase [Nitratifractor salsuginis]ADV47062.1 DNA methylase N-4/N-6 domain protein [Nitratifractor salsuginis DSM 16511]